MFLLLSFLLFLLVIDSAAGNSNANSNTKVNAHAHARAANHPRHHGGLPRGRGGANVTLARSITTMNTIDTAKKFSVVSVAVQHHGESSWHVPSLHDKHSAGWNRTFLAAEKMLRPYACTIRFYALGLEATLADFMKGGSGYLGLEVNTAASGVAQAGGAGAGVGVGQGAAPASAKETKEKGGKVHWYGFDKSEKLKLHCYYMTNKGYGSEFVDDPKTLGVAVYCPVTLDLEIGEYEYRKLMEPGFYCRSLADYAVKGELYLRPSDFQILGQADVAQQQASSSALHAAMDAAAAAIVPRQIVGEFTNYPTAARLQSVRLSEAVDPRPHAICTVQTFRNQQTGPMLYAFVKYHIALGWRVIIYDRFGMHREFMEELVGHDGVDYHPFTVFQLVNPAKYNDAYAAAMGYDRKVFYQMEKNWGYKGKKADTADQDQDKTKTYDYARIEYAHVDVLLFLDADEFFYCPHAVATHGSGHSAWDSQRGFQQKIMQGFSSQGIEEMRFVRIPYSGMAPTPLPGTNETNEQIWEKDFTENTEKCMLKAYVARDFKQVLACWSSASAYDNFPKSADLGSVCPFHYNHWSCDGMRNGGRDYVSTRCRCKVAFDLINGFEYKPVLKRCHLLHFNDNKYKFQSRREKHANDHGSIFEVNPIITGLFAADHE